MTLTALQSPELPAAQPAQAGVALLAADAEWAERLSPADRATARRLVVVPRIDLQPGPWTPPEGDPVTVLRGVVTRETRVAGRDTSLILGPGDILPMGAAEQLPCEVRWIVNEPSIVAVLDRRFTTVARRWPALTETLAERLMRQAARSCTESAILQLPHVEQRVLGMLWHLADRFGRVLPDGTVVELRLTHEQLGRLVGARRPTITLALGALQERHAVTRLADGRWLLGRGSADLLSPTQAISAG